MLRKNLIILKLRAALDFPTFPVNLWVFRVQEVWYATTLVCILLHGIHRVQQDTFLKDLFAPDGPSSALFGTLKNVASASCEEEFRNELVYWKENTRIVRYRHHVLPRSVRLGIFLLMQNEFILKILWLSCRGFRFRNCISENSLTLRAFQCWKTNFKTEICSCSGCLILEMLWIKETEVAKSVDDLMTSQSIGGHIIPNVEMIDAQIASALKRNITSQHFRRRNNVEVQHAQKQIRFCSRKIDCLHDLSVSLQGDYIQDFDTKWDQTPLAASETPKENVLESLYKMRIREPVQLQTVLSMYEQENDRDRALPSCHRLKTMVRRHIDQTWQVRNGKMSALRGNQENTISGNQMDSVQEKTLAVSDTEMIVDNQHNRHLVLQDRRHVMTAEDFRKEPLLGKAVHLEKVKERARIILKGIVRIRRVTHGIFPYVKSTKLNRNANSVTSVYSDILRLREKSPVKRRKKW